MNQQPSSIYGPQKTQQVIQKDTTMNQQPSFIYGPQKTQQVMQRDTIMNQQPASSVLGPQRTQQMVLLGPENTDTVCPFCNASIRSSVKYTTTSRTHIAAALCTTVCCCCCIPYSSDSAKNADHYCPNCQRYIGTYHR